MNPCKLFFYIESQQDQYVKRLAEWVKIKSVSSDPQYRSQCIDMVKFAAEEFKKIGAEVSIRENPAGIQHFPSGVDLPYPPILLASYGNDPTKKTVCIYGHLDVQPAEKSDGWDTEPFELVEIKGKMFGRGTTDDKGPVLGWLCALQAMRICDVGCFVNIRFIFECMEESGSNGLDELIRQEKDGFLKHVHYVCISDNYWLGTKKPCVTYGLRGIIPYALEISGPSQDLHSGVYGGTVYEPMTDLVYLMSKLVDVNGKILIPGVCDDVAEMTEAEQKLYEPIDFDIDQYKKFIGVSSLLFNKKEDLLQHRWRYPTLSLHGIEGAFSQPGTKTVIPGKVTGKFSIRTVPNMKVEDVEDKVRTYLERLHSELKTPNLMKLMEDSGSAAWVSDTKSVNYIAAREATKEVYGVVPDFTREGGSIPVTLTFQEVLGKSVMLLPMGRGDDGAHSQNEKLDRENFIKGIELFAAYLDELARRS